MDGSCAAAPCRSLRRARQTEDPRTRSPRQAVIAIHQRLPADNYLTHATPLSRCSSTMSRSQFPLEAVVPTMLAHPWCRPTSMARPVIGRLAMFAALCGSPCCNGACDSRGISSSSSPRRTGAAVLHAGSNGARSCSLVDQLFTVIECEFVLVAHSECTGGACLNAEARRCNAGN